jgi:hypothetical protein
MLVFPFPRVRCYSVVRMTRHPFERWYVLYASNAEHVGTAFGCTLYTACSRTQADTARRFLLYVLEVNTARIGK